LLGGSLSDVVNILCVHEIQLS